MQKRNTPLYLSRPNIEGEDIQNVIEVLKSGNLVQGSAVSKLEKRFCEILQTSNCTALSNGTATLHLSLLALGISKGDEVIVPAFSYIASANVVELVGAKPVFVDIDIDTFNINIEEIENNISKNTKAIIVVHEFGLPAEMDQIMFLAKKYNLFVIEDAACAIGSKYKGSMVGSIGDFGSFSLHPRKIITTGEGGIVTCREDYNETFMKVIRNHGVEYSNGSIEFIKAGYNYRLTDIQASLALNQLDRLTSIIEKRNALAQLYLRNLNPEKYKLPVIFNHCQTNWQTFHIIVNENINRKALIKYLADYNILVNNGAQCIPDTRFYKKKYSFDSSVQYPNSYKSYHQGLALPMCETYTADDINYTIQLLNSFL